RTWVFLGGRGAGKTRAGAEWVWQTAMRLGEGGRIALIAPTLNDARAVMIDGPSGLLNLPYWSGATYEPSRRRLRFPGGAVGLVFSAEEPQRLRGPQFHAAWGDEVCAWFYSEETLAMLRLGLRLPWPVRASDSLLGRGPSAPSGTSRPDAAWRFAQANLEEPDRAQAASDRVASGSAPKLVLTTTPKPGRLMRGVLAEAGCVRTHAGTKANARNLAPGFLDAMEDLYGGTRRAAQELEGQLLEAEGALFRLEDIARAKALGSEMGSSSPKGGSPLERVVVAVDPPAGTLTGRPRDACGIVVAGRIGMRFVVLEDRSAAGLSPDAWAGRVKAAVDDWSSVGSGARVVLESNQGGEMGEAVLRNCGLTAPVRRVHATTGKVARAEPVAALYEQGRVAHAPGLGALEEELMGLGAEEAGGRSPDRADALVWAITELARPPAMGPSVRRL
ncbi:terminase large subunit domain-containing protein, partial [Brevundimonas sp. GCM10030266]|uniref:terminase large subunit domain-containing protein n=1 Tax=Brevundimonas sp. GCM10030266 TaxID=3273386 RepID=UPI003608E636